MKNSLYISLLLAVTLVFFMPNILLATTVYDFVTNGSSAVWSNSTP